MKKAYKIIFILSLLIFVNIKVYSQCLYFTDSNMKISIKIDMDSSFKCNTLNILDGEYIVCKTEDLQHKLMIINLKNKMVDGVFEKFDSNGNIIAFGQYYADSLWTFYFNPSDTSFKIGTWIYNNAGNRYISKYQIPLSLIKKGFVDKIILNQNDFEFLEILYDTNFTIKQSSYYGKDQRLFAQVIKSNDTLINYYEYNEDGSINLFIQDQPNRRIFYNFGNDKHNITIFKVDPPSLPKMEYFLLSFPYRGFETIILDIISDNNVDYQVYNSLLDKFIKKKITY